MDDIERAWLACAIDGEGCISAVKNGKYQSVTLGVFNTNLDFIENCLAVAQLGQINTHHSKINKNFKPEHRWMVTGIENILSVLYEVSPYLIIKKEIAARAIDYLEHRVARYRKSITEDDRKRFEKVLAARVHGNAKI